MVVRSRLRSLAGCQCWSPWWRSDGWHPLASEDVYIMLDQGCCVQMDSGHPLSVRDTAVWEEQSSLLLLSNGANKSFTCSWGRRGVSVSTQGCQGENATTYVPQCMCVSPTSCQSFVMSFCLKGGKIVFIVKFWWRGTWELKGSNGPKGEG